MKIKIVLLLAAAVLLLTGFISHQEEGHPGKKVFVDAKCQTCHSVQAENLEIKTQKKTVVDLSNVGNVYTAKFIEDYLKKEDKLNDKAHPQAFKGSDNDLDKLVEWLTSLKNSPDDKDNVKSSKDTTKTNR